MFGKLATVGMGLLLFVELVSQVYPSSVFASEQEISISKPEVKKVDGTALTQVRSNSQVVLEVTMNNQVQTMTPYVAILEVRNSEDETTYLQYQIGELAGNSSQGIGISWTPAEEGDYAIRAFMLSSLVGPVILTPVVQSIVSVGSIEIEFDASLLQKENVIK